MRLLFAGALMAMCHVLLEPDASAGLKEHCVQAVASLAGLPDEELSFPQVT